VLAVLVTGGALAGAQSPRPDDRPHLLLVPHTPDGRAALERTDARVVARYEEFTLAEAAGGDDARLRRAGADRRDDMREVSLPAAELDPKADRASLAAKEAPERDEALAIVQFVGPVKEAWLERLEATGARVVQYAAQNGYVVHARGSALARVERLVGTDTAVRAVAPVRARDKIEDKLTRAGSRTVAVQTLAGPAGADARRDALAAGRRVRAESEVGELRTQFVELDGTEAATLAKDPAVVAIVPYGEPRLLDERAAQIVAGNVIGSVPSGPGYLGWHDAAGFTAPFGFSIDVTDDGLDNGSDMAPDHPDFYVDGDGAGLDRVTYAEDYTSDPDATDCGGHGTNVASIAAGYGAGSGAANQDAQGFKYGMGVAPRALIGASKVFNCAGQFDLLPGTTFTDLTSAAYRAGARISNNSWGISDQGEYGPDSQEYDALVRDARPDDPGDPDTLGNQQMVEVFAAGNEGDDVSGGGNEGYASVGSPATAKNVIAVGASESVRAIGGTDGCGASDTEANDVDDMINFSSRGPTDDLRLKPDLVAPGTHVAGAAPQHVAYDGNGVCNPEFPVGNPFYSLVSGSSQAAPEVSGAAALIREWYRRPGVGGAPPSPAMTKAILVNTATDIAGGDNGKGDTIAGAPNMDQGWGRVDVGEVLDDTQRRFYDQSTVFGGPEAPFLRAYEVADPLRPLKVTLAWTDAPGMAGANASFVNNLDLVVEAGGRTYSGNVFSGGLSLTGGSADIRNNVESVVLPAGTSGDFSVKVVPTNVMGDGVPDNPDTSDQDFALVVSNATLEQTSPVLVQHDPPSVDDTLPLGGNGALEPGESFTLDQQVRNAGNGPATGVSATLTAAGHVTITRPNATYGDLNVDQSGTNDPPGFEGGLAGAAPCGADANATLTLTTAPDTGSHTVPITLPTGSAAPATARNRTHSPALAIPDDSAAGVTSTLDVASAGRIRDLNVRVTGITHPWVGDLSIELIGPDGTSVTLARHPGGPDNSGNTFTNTVFDDEAAQNIAEGAPPYTGSFRPQGDQLARFDGKSQQGQWKLRVRDLAESDTGTLRRWGTDTSNAQCAPDTSPPLTVIDSGPSGLTSSRDAVFGFRATESDATFECELDGGDFAPCNAPQTYSGLADGEHTFAVRAFDAQGNVDPEPATGSWTVDATAPSVTVSSPSPGSTTTDGTPALSGAAGTAAADAGSVTVQLFAGTLASGLAAQTLVAPRDADGSWSVEPAAVAPGVYTARAMQSDAAGNVGASAPVTFTVGTSPIADAVGPRFLLAPAEEHLADALAGRLTAMAGCVAACRVTATLTLSGRTARRVGLGAGSERIGRATVSTRRDGPTRLRVPLTRRARTVLRSAHSVTTTLNLTVADAGGRVALRRPVALSRAAGVRRVASRGLRLWAACDGGCSVHGRLTIGARTARRLGLRGSEGSAVAIGTGSARATAGTPSRLVLRLSRRSRRALRNSRGVSATLEAIVTGVSGPAGRAMRGLTLRR
jgi:subtilisin-like proprotein convertase family protein